MDSIPMAKHGHGFDTPVKWVIIALIIIAKYLTIIHTVQT